jgi:hypothetical protein
MKDYRTIWNKSDIDAKTGFEKGEYYDLETQPSLTDPSQAMEAKDIINMFSRGGAVRVLRAQNFGDSSQQEPVPTEFDAIASRIHTMDRVEKAEAILDIKETINKKAEAIDKNKKDVAAKKQRAKIKAELEKQNPKGDE